MSLRDSLKPLVGAALLFGLAMPASATTGLQWDWETGKKRRYVLASQTALSSPMLFQTMNNIDRRVLDWHINMVTTCEAKGTYGKKAAEVHCTIDEIAMKMRPTRGDENQMIDLINEWDEKLTGAKLVLKWGYDGRIHSYELEGIEYPRTNQRVREIEQSMRLMIGRTFAGLELQLPKKGDDKGKVWELRDPIIMGFPTLYGDLGGMKSDAQVKETEGSNVIIDVYGEGTRGPAITGSDERPLNMWDMKMVAQATFDLEEKSLISSLMEARGVVTPSSQLAEGGKPLPYVQLVASEQVPLDAELAPLPENEAIAFDGRIIQNRDKRVQRCHAHSCRRFPTRTSGPRRWVRAP
jgi:hypothetical protein